MKYTKIIHGLLVMALGVFFCYAGVKKFIPKPPRVNAEAQAQTLKAVEEDTFERPVTFRLTMKMFRASGFIYLVGLIQITAGILMLFPLTRLVGLLLLLPICMNIFGFHFFMDNRPDENVETGLYLLANIVLLWPYTRQLKGLFISPDKAAQKPELEN